MKIAITGASGFLGRNLIDELKPDHRIRGLTRNVSANRDDEIDWLPGDLEDPESLDCLVDGCDAVVHAAVAMRGNSFIGGEGDPIEYLQANVMGTARLIEAAVDAGCGRFVFVSTGAVHGKTLPGEIDETHPHWPTSLYGIYKASCESLVHGYASMGKIVASTIRPVSIYGIDEPIGESRYAGLVGDILGGRQVDISGGGKVVHVRDVAGAIRLILETAPERVSGQTFNAVDRYVPIAEVADIASELCGVRMKSLGQPASKASNMLNAKLRSLGFNFGGIELLKETISQLVRGLGSS
ncbi:MAG: NAD(P)-dependent oxidoreductase [Planctomycetota bacterium]